MTAESIYPEKKPVGAVRKVLSMPVRAATAIGQILMNRRGWAGQAGQTFDGDRDMYAKLGYKRQLAWTDFDARKARGGIAHRIIEAMPKKTWQNPPVVDEDLHDEKPTAFDTAWMAMNRRLRALHYFKRADILAGVGRFSVIFIGANDGKAPDQPLEKVRRAEDVMYLSVYSEGNTAVAELDIDPRSPRFGLPKIYELQITVAPNTTAGQNVSVVSVVEQKIKVHHTRIIHVAEGLLEDDVYGKPRLEAVWNYLDDLDKVCGGSAEATWKSVWMGFQLDIDKELDLAPDDEDALADEVAEYEHGISRFMRTKGIKMTPLGSKIVDPRGMFSMIAGLISGTIDIPLRILFGSERGQLASQGDERAFNGTVKERQTDFAETIIFRPFIDKMIAIGAFPMPKAGIYNIIWPDIATLTLREQADVAARMAQAAEKLANQKVTIISAAEARQKWFGLPAKVPVEGAIEPGQAPDPVEPPRPEVAEAGA